MSLRTKEGNYTRRLLMSTFRCRTCGATSTVDRDIDVDDVECPVANCGSDDLAEFVEADDDDEEDGDDD